MSNFSCKRSCAYLFALFCLQQIGFAAGVVTNCDEASLRAAMVGGGTVTFACDGTITLTNTLAISGDTTVDASAHDVTLSGNNTTRVFTVTAPVTLSLINLVIANGVAVGTNGSPGQPGGTGQGGGVFVFNGNLTVLGCAFNSNRASGGKGGDYYSMAPFSYVGAGGAACGGAIYLANGSLFATNCFFSGNLAGGGAGGDANPVGHPGVGGHGFGGAICAAAGSVTLVGCEFQTNQAQGGLAGTYRDTLEISGGAFGGAICEQGGSLTAIHGRFLKNAAFTTNPVSLYSSGSGGAVKGGAIFNDGGSLTVADSEFSSNRVAGGNAIRHLGTPGAGQGGAICNLGQMNIKGCILSNNVVAGGNNGLQAENGDGGAVFNSGFSRINDSLFAGNTASGGIGYNGGLAYATNGSGRGGAIVNSNTVEFVNCTFSLNLAFGAPGGFSGAAGSHPYPGSPAFGGAIYTTGSCSVTNSTLTGNQALGGSHPVTNSPPDPSQAGGDALGGAVCNTGGTAQLVHVTFSEDSATAGLGSPNGQSVGGGILNSNGTVTLFGSIIASGPSGANASGTLTDGGYNISSDASCNFTNTGSLNNTDPKLGPLDNYGGPTPTMALLAGSPAIDGGNSGNFPPADQRGRSRPYGAASDIGAFESSAPFVIRGKISGATFVEEDLVHAGTFSASTTNRGFYSLEGLTPNTYSVTPSTATYLIVPSNRVVTVGPDQLNVDFKAYRWNALSPEGVSNGVLHLAYAGTNGQSVRVLASSNLFNWAAISTNVVPVTNLFDIFDTTDRPARFYRTARP